MAYNTLSQYEHDQLSDGRASQSPPPYEDRYQPIDLERENLGGREAMEDAHPPETSLTRRIGSLLQSIAPAGGTYNTVEDDEYDEADHHEVRPPAVPLHVSKRQERAGLGIDTAVGGVPHSRSASPEADTPLRTASISHSLPLNSPTPDLQALQGAYVGNVERLEESAERLSTSSTLEEEIQKLKLEQRRSEERRSSLKNGTTRSRSNSGKGSAASHANSIIAVNSTARSGGYSPGGYITSPKGSIGPGFAAVPAQTLSISRIKQMSGLSEEHEAEFADSSNNNLLQPIEPPPPPPPPPHRTPMVSSNTAQVGEGDEYRQNVEGKEDRPPTRGSTDSNEQVMTAFLDFDGVHRVMHPNAAASRQSSVRRQDSQASRLIVEKRKSTMPKPEAPPQGMVYYPAPVPMMLNLPQRLSRLQSATEMERRRQQGMSMMPNETRKTSGRLAGDAIKDGRIDSSNLPPQLRASAFFEHKSVRQEIEIKSGSAVDTLDAILDAAAFAPVTAFVDHPFAGRLGNEVYGKSKEARKSKITPENPKRKSSIGSMMKMVGGKKEHVNLPRMRSSSILTTGSKGRLASREAQMEDTGAYSDEGTTTKLERDAEDSMLPSGDELSDEQNSEQDDDGQENDQDTMPTTLLAELQMRKDQQKRRNRQAPELLGKGITLLQQDAIAQIQKHARKQKHITLAWEDREAADQQNYDDEDVPLGVLFAGKKTVDDANRPMGLMERRDIEENEPLSRRRARLTGVPVDQSRKSSMPFQQRASTMYGMDAAAALNTPAAVDDRVGETLAERLKRIKAEKGTTTGLTSDFASEVLSQFTSVKPEASKSKTPNAEETLGQRRKRLKEEAEARKASGGSIEERPALKPRHSMADILSVHPVNSRKTAADSRESLVGNGLQGQRQSTLPQQFQQTQMAQNYRTSSMPMVPPAMTFNNPYMPMVMPNTALFPAMFPQDQPQSPYFNPASNMPYFSNPSTNIMNFNNINTPGFPPMMQENYGGLGSSGTTPLPPSSMNAAGGVQYPMLAAGMGPPLDKKQRANIDRWRQSIVGGGR